MQSLPDLSQLSQLSHAQKDELIGQLFQVVQTLTTQLEVLQKRVSELQRRPRVSADAELIQAAENR